MRPLVSIIGLITLALGLWIWSGHGAPVVPWHIRLGFLLVLLLLTTAILAARAGAPIGQVALAIILALLLPVVGLTQSRVLVGPSHWIVQVVHLAIAIAAIGVTQRLGAMFLKPKPTHTAGADPGSAR
jgi:hypothetical protein